MTAQTIDQAKAEAFAGQVVGILNGAALAQMMSVGHHTGLLDTMATLPPSTSEQIAEAAGLNERYVREWLGSMVTGRIVEYDPSTRTYRRRIAMTSTETMTARFRAAIVTIAPAVLLAGFVSHPSIGMGPPDDAAVAAAVAAGTTRWGLWASRGGSPTAGC